MSFESDIRSMRPTDAGKHGGMYEFLNKMSRHYHLNSVEAGWWDELARVQEYLPSDLQKTVELWFLGTKIALIHSEISEMMEGLRKGQMDDHLPLRKMEEVEAADILIRLFDYAGRRSLDLAGATYEKGNYNQVRPDHDVDSRNETGGKKF